MFLFQIVLKPILGIFYVKINYSFLFLLLFQPKPFRLDFYEKSYTFKKSRYGNKNALSLLDIPFIREHPLLYRDRIYYFETAEEVEKVAKEPLKYLVEKCYPKDISVKAIVFVIGSPKTGKSTLAKLIESKLGLVRIKLSTIIEEYVP